IVSKARLDLPDPERPVMQISLFRGNRTVMSLRLGSRAPWTTSSSAAIATILATERTFASVCVSRLAGNNRLVRETAQKSFVATSVAVAVVAVALALWHLKVLVALLLLALVISSAMRPGVEWMHRHRIPRGFGVTFHYAGFLIAIGLLLWLIVPRALDQVE